MNPVNHINHSAPITGSVGRSRANKHNASDSSDWFSLSSNASGKPIHATAIFAAGSSVSEISAEILSHISEQGSY